MSDWWQTYHREIVAARVAAESRPVALGIPADEYIEKVKASYVRGEIGLRGLERNIEQALLAEERSAY